MVYPVTHTEHNELLSVWESSVKATHHFLSRKDFEFYKELVPTFFDQVTLFSVKDEDQRITGFIGTNGDQLEMLFIDAAHRGKGLGKALLRYAVEHLAVTKVDVNEQNEQAVKFYEHSGFETKSSSDTDGFGKPYPILHMELNPYKNRYKTEITGIQ